MPDRVPWKRLVAEGAAIIVSILLAFLIDASWDEARERAEEREILAGLRAELVELQGRLDEWSAFNRTAESLVARAVEAPIGSLSQSHVDSLLTSVWAVNVIDRGGGPLDAVLASGRLELIRSQEIRDRLARWPDRMEDIHTNDLSLRDFVWRQLVPYMARFGVPEHYCSTEIFCVTDGPPPASHQRLLEDTEFRTLLSFKRIANEIIGIDHADASAEAGELIELIDDYLAR